MQQKVRSQDSLQSDLAHSLCPLPPPPWPPPAFVFVVARCATKPLECNNSCGVHSDRGVSIYIFWCGCDVQQKVRRQDSLEDVVSVSAHSLWEAAPRFWRWPRTPAGCDVQQKQELKIRSRCRCKRSGLDLLRPLTEE